MYDPELKYCPQCKVEYMAHAVSCADCNIDLVEGAVLVAAHQEKEKIRNGRSLEINENDDLVIIHAGQMADLKKLQGLFQEEMIASCIVGDDKSCGKGCCPSTFYLQIRREEAPDAARIIQQEHRRLTGLADHETETIGSAFDPNAKEVLCPACGYSFKPTEPACPDCGLCFG